ncbi:hypothetical protein COW98_01875 [Candidatus Roizmanbacteria bacterium CG22_combo_CG10-13_8_21_14_all_35_9]|uniref:DUF5660 domain-containing protein n=4 Tax=Candidatus Roizmaniibacteriota TaxID=1752723 RepID=A0A2M8F343_9BACT|nr:hypothetical protein [Candidatus Roizmanbacteria bacterium]PIP14983.1 MAG: hypothetical protein COX47_02135 [Candidatus Roizmanbacteria bacterium CG23_combo_of_CG06-09_8_20_14_all_35_49]PIP62841.1 MAG: hypothetical protein COW98_01875 [Candidatus Roizmanbacteria bacterium CG22_combo_CG10-13_8_21_14_all_35_9]PIY71313.1 MAG: hypothetical protein COY88_01045 [Candidatus Roizmanbacteria bacterium CG_4_10_14_0_8_um_filter_35_28]PJC33698.1 MAG: hypothetical protein CO048_02515 [Candidatus Roizmanb
MTKAQSSKFKIQNDNNPLESLRNFDNYEDDDEYESLGFNLAKKKEKRAKKEFKVFNYQEYSETTLIKKKISELSELIKKEIEALKKQGSEFNRELNEVEKIALQELPEKPGIYHVRFLEIILEFVRHLRARVGESKTWMEAMVTRRKKRGSLFAVRSKKMGTQYSLSQELQSARSIQ